MPRLSKSSFSAGATFWSEPDAHLWAIISDPTQDPDRILIVNLTTFDAHSPPNDAYNDRACLIEPGEHPFVTRTTCVHYGGAHLPSLQMLEWRLQNGKLKFGDALSLALLARIREAAEKSLHMEMDHFQLLLDQGLVK
jgi:hypothetical protein